MKEVELHLSHNMLLGIKKSLRPSLNDASYSLIAGLEDCDSAECVEVAVGKAVINQLMYDALDAMSQED